MFIYVEECRSPKIFAINILCSIYSSNWQKEKLSLCLIYFILFYEIDIVNIFSYIDSQEGDVPSEMELIDLRNDFTLKGTVAGSIPSERNIWSLIPKDTSPILLRAALDVNAFFCFTYLHV